MSDVTVAPPGVRRRRLRGLSAVVAALSLVTGVAMTALLPADAGTTPAGAVKAPAGLASLRWGACPSATDDARMRCATVRVPLDYRHPQRRAIDVMISRIPAAKPEQRQGAIILNGGGPGANLNIPLVASRLPDLADSYDLIGFDPRGTGHSTPMSCGRTRDELIRDEELELLAFPAADGSIGRNLGYAHRVARQCAAHSGDLLPYLNTADIARDLDRIRVALGEPTVSFYGQSWGTYLGAVYRTLFPSTIDRMVLDSAMDPGRIGYDEFRDFSAGMQDRWPDLADAAVDNAGTVGLGTTPTQVRRNYLALTSRLDRHPVRRDGTAAPVTGNLIRLLTRQYSLNANLADLLGLWAAAVRLDAGTATDADHALVETAATTFVTANLAPGVPDDNWLSIPWAVSCGDQAWPRDARTYARNTAADRSAHPLTAGAPANITPCAAWPVRPAAPATTVTSTGRRNVLILQNRRDPATPLRSAMGMRRALGTDAAFVDIDAGGHGVISQPQPNMCAVFTMHDFFMDGALPAADTTCQ
ncbi:alpha/beta fold hydrolase [Mangrovihabitans endophyticus]|uniref:Hydrolase n=1 Tax=Mangrovihabitans endophyticus TaxID=1751298 RepID=A0A8J3FLR1_9ACTN|nr:alpha/beta fold hydrolase [Mangrovihabitans endophyticus]GGK78076.1 hydrolase [Mangrovihabitans endophyticus]